MTKQPIYEATQDERDKPKFGPFRSIENWPATDLRRAMMDDARKIKETAPSKRLRYVNGHDKTAEQKQYELIKEMKLIGKPCTKHEIADAMGVLPHTAYSIMRPLVMADIVTTDREHNKAPIVYSLVDGYDEQEELDL